MKTITTHYINGKFVESHGKETLDLVRPTDKQVIGRVTLGDEDDTRCAIQAAKEKRLRKAFLKLRGGASAANICSNCMRPSRPLNK